MIKLNLGLETRDVHKASHLTQFLHEVAVTICGPLFGGDHKAGIGKCNLKEPDEVALYFQTLYHD